VRDKNKQKRNYLNFPLGCIHLPTNKLHFESWLGLWGEFFEIVEKPDEQGNFQYLIPEKNYNFGCVGQKIKVDGRWNYLITIRPLDAFRREYEAALGDA
jgi:hypothetical protein